MYQLLEIISDLARVKNKAFNYPFVEILLKMKRFLNRKIFLFYKIISLLLLKECVRSLVPHFVNNHIEILKENYKLILHRLIFLLGDFYANLNP